MKMVKCAELVLDFDLYPRNNVDNHNVGALIHAMDAGVELPPVIACKKTKRVSDGFHRIRAKLQRDGPDAKIEAVFKDYKDDAALFMDAMRHNASHGAKLDSADRSRCLIVAERLGLSLAEVGGVLHIPADTLGSLRVTRTAVGAGGLSIPLKRTVEKFAGCRLTKRQEQANVRLSGMNQAFYANQLIELIESKMLDTSDVQLMDRLQVLNELLDGVLGAVK